MYDMRKMRGWVYQGLLRSRRRLTTTAMTWEGAAFLSLVQIRLDRRVFNTLLVFISPLSLSPFSPSGDVVFNVCGSSEPPPSSPHH